MALIANLFGQLGIVAIGAGFGIVWFLPGPANAVLFVGAEALGAGMSALGAFLERRCRKS